MEKSSLVMKNPIVATHTKIKQHQNTRATKSQTGRTQSGQPTSGAALHRAASIRSADLGSQPCVPIDQAAGLTALGAADLERQQNG